MSTPETSDAEVPSPSWSRGDRVTIALAIFLLCWGMGALLMALAGVFHWWTVLPVTGVLFMLVRRWVPQASVPVDRWWLTVALLVIALTAVNVAHRGEHLLTGLDSGTYLAVAGWLAQDGSLLVDAQVGSFENMEGLRFDLPGFYDRLGGRDALEPQFMHAFPAIVGTIIDMAGVRAGLVIPPLISAVCLLALYSLARRFTYPAPALLAVALFGTSLVFIYYARTPFTELLMATFVLSGLSLLVRAEEQASRPAGALAGALLGGAVLVRLDGIVLLLPVIAYILLRSRGDESTERVLRGTRWGMFLVALVGLAESLFVAPAYILERRGLVVPVLVALLLLILANDVLGQKAIYGLGAWMRSRQVRLFAIGVVLFGLLLGYGWFVRPLLADAAGGSDTATVQQDESLEFDPTRSYFENSVRWLTWYQGPAFIVLGFAGAAVLAHRGLRRDPSPSALLVVGILLTFGFLYLWQPSVAPYHIWAMRRFVTVVIPFGCLTAAVATESLYGLIKRSIRPSSTANWAAAFIALALMLPSLNATVPVWNHHEYEGLAADMDEMCEALGDDAYVLIDGVALGARFVQSYRSYCGVPAAWTESLDHLDVELLEQAIAASGARLYIASLDHTGVRFLNSRYLRLELTLNRHPTAEAEFPIGISLTSKGS